MIAISRTVFEDEDYVRRTLRKGVEVLEEIMGQARDIPHVFVVVDPEFLDPEAESKRKAPVLGLNWRGVIKLRHFAGGVYYHELGHFFYPGYPRWLSEGGAEFLESYALNLSEGRLHRSIEDSRASIERSRELCVAHGASDIHNWNRIWMEAREKDIPLHRDLNFCDYTLGETFMWGMYDAIGRDATLATMRDIFNLPFSTPLLEEKVYRSFLANVPAGKEDEFREVYSRLHGGPIPDG